MSLLELPETSCLECGRVLKSHPGHPYLCGHHQRQFLSWGHEEVGIGVQRCPLPGAGGLIHRYLSRPPVFLCTDCGREREHKKVKRCDACTTRFREEKRQRAIAVRVADLEIAREMTKGTGRRLDGHHPSLGTWMRGCQCDDCSAGASVHNWPDPIAALAEA